LRLIALRTDRERFVTDLLQGVKLVPAVAASIFIYRHFESCGIREAAHDLKKTSKNTVISAVFVACFGAMGYKARPSVREKNQCFS
jgi:hypothetical protein